MKLLTKLNIRYISYSLVVMLVSSIVIYFILSLVIKRQMDEELITNLQRTEKHLAKNPQTEIFDPYSEINKTDKIPFEAVFSDTLINNEQENELEEYRQIQAVKNIGGTNFSIVIRKSKIESEDLLESLAIITVLAMLLLTLTLILVNRAVSKSIWLPFNKNLKIIAGFSVNDKIPVLLEKSGISEFEELNIVITQLTMQIIADFNMQKQFSEDVSHELQTPLAIINSHLETLLNESGLTQQQTEMVGKIYESVRRLSKLNKELVLLMKIENNQFPVSETINLTKVFEDKISEFSELIELKNLSIQTNFKTNFEVKMPVLLAEILVKNLLMNSINHNINRGKILIESNNKSIKISNSGIGAIARPDMLFNRFYKENVSSNSVGLGLAIVKKICDGFSLSIQYSFSENSHIFTLVFL